ncbi:MAG: phasin family protein [Cellvibrionaceae bacterium]|nr:phasin family protein [Cellvibrionaceae bacterium]MCV6624826.1 phasin family protein [Cellvibrionaceae bacterium]
MFESFGKQFKNAFKPMGEMVAINAKTLESLSQQQTQLFGQLLQSNLKHAQTLAEQRDMAAYFDAQRAYVAELQQELVQAGQDMMEVLQESQQQASSAWQPAQEAAPAKPAKVVKATKTVKKAKPQPKPKQEAPAPGSKDAAPSPKEKVAAVQK